ncbi:hypothetical protein [Natroniella sp. ANB-PHB2]|uniref:hypothetical protein n=1 Tax=Natroniella sp. ANB-PHB2 TaxID=3384444 RepID=UPI0038D4A36E
MKKSIIISLVLTCLLIFGLRANLYASVFDWYTYGTDNFLLFYPTGYEYQAQETIYYLEKYRSEVMELTGNQDDIKVKVVLGDLGLFTNGYADPVDGKMGIFTNNPSSRSGLSDYENWYRLVNVHELVHIAQMTNTSGASDLTTSVFGNLFSPNLHAPLWLIEGIAVYGESQTSPYEGRLNSAYYDAIIATKVEAGELPSMLEITYSHNYFPAGHQYLYGAKFFQYLADTYGEEKFADLFSNYGSYYWAAFAGGFFPKIGLDKAAKEVYGKRFPELYQQWQEYEEERYQDWSIAGDEVITNSNGYLSALTTANDKLYYFKAETLSAMPFMYSRLNKLIEYDPKLEQERVLLETREVSDGSLQVEDNELYYAVNDSKSGYSNIERLGYGDVSVLYHYDLLTGDKEELLTAEFKDFVVIEDDKIIYVKDNKEEFGSEIWQYQEGKQKKLGIIDQLISEVIAYEDQLIVVSKGNLSSWGINYLDLEELSLEPLLVTSETERAIEVIEGQLYFTASYDGYQEVYNYNLETDQLFKLTEQGYAERGVVINDQFYFCTITANGMAIYKQEEKLIPYYIPEQKILEEVELDFAELGVELTKEPAAKKNLSYLLKPNIRFFPYLVAGSDGLGLNNYYVLYSESGGVDFYWTTKMLQPLTANFSYRNKGEQRVSELNLSYPAYQSDLEGLAAVELDYTTDFSEAIPGLKVNFNYPRQNIVFHLQSKLKSDGVNAQLVYQYLFDNSSLVMRGSSFEQFSKNNNLRGFDSKYEKYYKDDASGFQLGIEYIHKLAELRKGSWNPNLFVGDLYGSLFVDYANLDELESEQIAYGYQLAVESGLGNWFYAVPKLGISISERERSLYFGVDTAF